MTTSEFERIAKIEEVLRKIKRTAESLAGNTPIGGEFENIAAEADRGLKYITRRK